MTPEEENARYEHWTEPVHKKEWVAEKEIEPWNLFVCSVISQALNDMVNPEPVDVGGWNRWSKERKDRWRRTTSIEAEQFFYSEKLEYWCDQFDCNLDTDVVKSQMRAFKKRNLEKINKVRGDENGRDN